MGMYDRLKVEYPIARQAPEFQTKSLVLELNHYVLDAEGALLLDGEPVDYTGDLTFYGFLDDDGINKGRGWVEYVADMENGRLMSIELVELTEPEAEPIEEPSR